MKISKKVSIICKTCGKKHLVFPSRLRRGLGKYCSRSCFLISNGKQMMGNKNINYIHGKAGSKEMIVRKNLRRMYGISLEQKQHMLISQDHKCAICGTPIILHSKRGSQIDHNHNTGKIRQLLCTGCNCGIGNFKENIDTLQKAISYLRKWGT